MHRVEFSTLACHCCIFNAHLSASVHPLYCAPSISNSISPTTPPPPFPRASQGTEGRQDGFWGILLGERARCIKVCSGNANLKWLWTCPHTPPPTISHFKNLVKIPQLNAIQHKCSLIPNLQWIKLMSDTPHINLWLLEQMRESWCILGQEVFISVASPYIGVKWVTVR